MYEFLGLTSPFDDDDDFAFEEGHAELAAEIREYADDDDDEFNDEERASLTIVQPLPPGRRILPVTSGRSPVKRAERSAATSGRVKRTRAENKKPGASKTVTKPVAAKKSPPGVPKRTASPSKKVSG